MSLTTILIPLLVATAYCMAPPFGPANIPALAKQCKQGIKCRFLTCSTLPIIFLSAPGKTANPAICRRGQNIGAIFEFGEPSVKTRMGRLTILTSISSWRPRGLSHVFAADVFEPRSISGLGNSGLTRKFSNGNQNAFIHGTCFVVPVLEYEQIRPNGRASIRTTSNKKDCFVFVGNSPSLVFEVQWFDSGDDLDISVKEPDGTVVDYITPRSECGRLNGGDGNIDGCDRLLEGREKLEYFKSCTNFQEGKYETTVRHATNCREGLTRYEIRVIMDGRLRAEMTGTSNHDNGEVVDTLCYDTRADQMC